MNEFNKKLKKLKNDVINNIKSINKIIAEKDLQDKPVNVLINMTHPSDRDEFQRRYNEL